MASLDRHVLLKKLRDVLESLRGRVAGRNKEDADEAISMVGFLVQTSLALSIPIPISISISISISCMCPACISCEEPISVSKALHLYLLTYILYESYSYMHMYIFYEPCMHNV